MKHIINQHPHHIVCLERGEEFHTALKAFCTQHGIGAASMRALGAADEVDLAFYLLDTKEYETTTVHEELEIITITGNIASLDGKVAVHAHGTFGKRDLSTIGGHVARMVVSATCEVMLTVHEGTIIRGMDERTGLTLMQSCDLS